MSAPTPRDVLEKFPVARRFVVGFAGTALPNAVRELLRQGLAGVALYPRNFSSIEGLTALTAEIRAAASGPVLIGMDQEGGTRFSLPAPFGQWPSPAKLGAAGDAGAVRSAALEMGRELAAVGCNLDFAPMLDLHVNPASPVTLHRSYGSDPELVGRMGAAFIAGLAGGGVLGCAKHFPGHGDAAVDPHEDLPVFHGTVERLAQADLVPFAAAIAASVPTIMTAHILLPNIDPVRPASLSRRLLTGLLRGEMHFQGIILADDLGMGAIARRFTPGEAAVQTFAAGTDIAMLCHEWSLVTPALAATARAMEEGTLSLEEWQTAGERINRVLVSAQRFV
jgi:beta-N-acetylhexosaminidase